MKKDIFKEIVFLLFIFLFFSMVGWIWELVFELIDAGLLANHGVLFGPWLPIYGTAGLLMYVLLNRYKKNPIIVFMGSFVFCTIIEYITSWYLETFKNDLWWDYSELPFNINGRVSLITSSFFGLLGLLGIYVIIPKLRKVFDKIKIKKISIVVVSLFVIFIVDAIHSIDHPNHVVKYKISEIELLDIF